MKVCACHHPDCPYCGLDVNPFIKAAANYGFSSLRSSRPLQERMTLLVPTSTVDRLRHMGVRDDRMAQAMVAALEDLLHRQEYEYYSGAPTTFATLPGSTTAAVPNRPKEHARCLDCDEFDHSGGDHCLCGSDDCELWQTKLVKEF